MMSVIGWIAGVVIGILVVGGAILYWWGNMMRDNH